MLPTDAKKRKDIPIYSGFIKYFPDAIAAVAELSRIGGEQHNPGKPLFWDRSKSADDLDAAARHLTDHASGVPLDTDMVLHLTKNAWRSMAALQKALETRVYPAAKAWEGVEPIPNTDFPSRWLMLDAGGTEWETANFYTFDDLTIKFPISTPIFRLPPDDATTAC